MSIGQAASTLGVSTRTLRHWDCIGLLVPSRTWGDYRLYTDADLDVALEILVYRETGMPLKEIAEIINDGAPSQQRLRNQQRYLREQIVHLRQMYDAVTNILEKDMTMNEKIEALGNDWTQYEAEAQHRWGDTEEWRQAQQAQKSMSPADWEAAKAEMADFGQALIDAHRRGVRPGSEEARDLVVRHRAQITQWFECSPNKQVCLARMYVADERFHEAYAGEQDYLLELVEAQAELQGVDLSQVEWK